MITLKHTLQPRGSLVDCFLYRVEDYLNGPREESAKKIPILFVASPSAKDPTWEERSPGTLTSDANADIIPLDHVAEN